MSPSPKVATELSSSVVKKGGSLRRPALFVYTGQLLQGKSDQPAHERDDLDPFQTLNAIKLFVDAIKAGVDALHGSAQIPAIGQFVPLTIHFGISHFCVVLNACESM